jgi:DNA-binding transcriptional LysR family regulator
VDKRRYCSIVKQSKLGMRHSTIDFEALRYFLVSAEAGKLGRAAETLGIGTASLSRRIARIEDELGLTLFERGHDGIRLTNGGQAIIIHARRVLANLDALLITGNERALCKTGQIHLGMRLPSVGEPIQSLLAAWHERFPHVELIVHELNERDILTAIEERRIDLAFMTKHTVWPRAVATPIYRERLLAALPKQHRLTRKKHLVWEDLREEVFLVQGWEESQTAREYYASFLGSGIHFGTHSASKQSVLGLVGAGFGITLVTQAQAHVRIPGVVFRHILEDNATLEVQLLWAPENKEAAVGRFVSFMREMSISRGLL